MTNVILKNFEAHEENGKFLARATYQFEDEKGTWEMVANNIVLPLCRTGFSLSQNYDGYEEIDFGLGLCRIESCDQGGYIKTTLIKEKIHDMTVEEIEEKLGYRVRIVKGEDKND